MVKDKDQKDKDKDKEAKKKPKQADPKQEKKSKDKMGVDKFPKRKRLDWGKPQEIRPDGKQVTSKVVIRADKQKDNKEIRFTVGDRVDVKKLADPKKFKPGRFVANIILEKETAMDEPVSLTIEITQEDVDRAKQAQADYFTIGYHDATKMEWVVMKDNVPCQVGDVEVPLTKVGDPPIAVSP